MTDARIVLTTVALHETAIAMARTLVQERLAACVNISPGVESIYWWQGRIEQTLEYVLMIKTTAAKIEALRERMMKLHPYELPEFVILPIEGGSEAYLQWIGESVAE
jgi:periplasmic divalent cation tolerance protein